MRTDNTINTERKDKQLIMFYIFMKALNYLDNKSKKMQLSEHDKIIKDIEDSLREVDGEFVFATRTCAMHCSRIGCH